jgi:hypothetical protein
MVTGGYGGASISLIMALAVSLICFEDDFAAIESWQSLHACGVSCCSFCVIKKEILVGLLF